MNILRKRVFNLPIPYNIQNPSPGEYRFVTDKNLIYWVTFQPLEFPNSGRLYSFAFFAEGNSDNTGTDNRIEATIVKILQDFWQDDSNVALIVCETDQNSPKARMRLFNRWYRRAEMNGVILKYDCQYEGDDLAIYSSLYYHCDNPLAKLFVEDFQLYIDALKG